MYKHEYFQKKKKKYSPLKYSPGIEVSFINSQQSTPWPLGGVRLLQDPTFQKCLIF